MNILKSVILLVMMLFISTYAFAEVKVFDKEIEEVVGRNQSQEQVESFALQKAKRLAVEEAGTYISTLTIVKNSTLQKDEVMALASGIVQSKIIGIPEVSIKNGISYIRVHARIEVDTSTLDNQIMALLKESGTLKKLEEERKKNRELEDQIASLKGVEIKKLEDLNAQALAIEKEREKQRLFLEEQALKAKQELKQAEIERIQKEKELQNKTKALLEEQEQERRKEADVIAVEQDRIKKTQLENEQRWNELERKAKLAQTSWVAIDDSLSLKQGLDEAKQLKTEIVKLSKQVDQEYQKYIEDVKNNYALQKSSIKQILPSAPAPKDDFETSEEFQKRMLKYNSQLVQFKEESQKKIDSIEDQEKQETEFAKLNFIKRKVILLAPFVQRLETLQTKEFVMSESSMTVKINKPDADKKRLPFILSFRGKQWTTYWDYMDIDKAKQIYSTMSYLKVEGVFKISDNNTESTKLIGFYVTSPVAVEKLRFNVDQVEPFFEISYLIKLKQDYKAVYENNVSWQVLANVKSLDKIGMQVPPSFKINDGIPFVAYIDTVNKKNSVLIKLQNGTVKNMGEIGRGNSISLYIYKDIPFIAYRDYLTGEIVVMEYDTVSWRKLGTGFKGKNPSLFINNDQLYIAFSKANTGRACVLKYNLEYHQEGWEYIGEQDISWGSANNIKIFVSNDIPYLAYEELVCEDKGGLILTQMYCNQWNALHAVQVKKFENKSWKAVGGKTYAPVADGYTTSFYVYNEVPYIAYVSKRTTKVNVEKFENGEWQIIENNINNQHISSTSLFIFDNILYLAYESSGNLTVVKYDKNEWKIVGKEIPHVVTYEISVYKHTPYIAYGSFNNKDLITIMRYSTYNPNTEPDPPFLQ